MAIGTSELRQGPVGVFDSGVGGLSVLRELQRQLPQEDFIYVADSAYCPYGTRAIPEIIERACALTDFLLNEGVKLIVVACNAATVSAIEFLRAHYSLSFVGMEPGVKPAAARTRSGVVGVLTTTVTASGERLHRLIRQHAGSVRVLTQGCPGWVECVEGGALDTSETRALIEHYVAPLLQAGADTLVLGCTHYPFLRPLLEAVAGPRVALIETGEAVALRTRSLLQQEGLLATSAAQGRIRCYTSGEVAHFADVGSRLWGAPLPVGPMNAGEPVEMARGAQQR